MSIANVIDKLVLLKKVAGFANLGVIPGARILTTADGYLGDLAGHSENGGELSLDNLKKALGALKNSIMPSQDLCQKGMAEVDAHLNPMQQQRREQTRAGAAPDRPRGA